MSEVKKKADDEPSIIIRIKDQGGGESKFRIRRSTKMGVLFKAYVQLKGVEERALCFMIHGENINPDATPIDLGLENNDAIDALLKQLGMISTFTSSDTSDALIQYLMLIDEERATVPTPTQQLREKQTEADADNNETFTYIQNPDILHPSQMNILCELLSFVWDKTSNIGNSERVDMRLTLSDDQLIAILASLDASLDNKYKTTSLNDRFKELFDQVPGAHTEDGHKIALRMTKGPTNSCINFHCDGMYASSTSQIPLNAASEYDGGALCFFMKNHLHMVPRVPGSLVQHPPNVLHGVSSVTRGTRKSLFIVDESNGLGAGGVLDLSIFYHRHHIIAFLAQREREKRQREVEQGGSLANKKRKTGGLGIDTSVDIKTELTAASVKSEKNETEDENDKKVSAGEQDGDAVKTEAEEMKKASHSVNEEEIAMLRSKVKALEEIITTKDEEIASLKESLKNSKPIDVIDLTDETTSSKLPQTEDTPKSALAIQHEQNQKMAQVKEEKIAAETALEDVREDLEDNQEDMGRQVLFTNFLQSKIDELAALAEAGGADRARVAEIKGRSYSSMSS